MVDFTSNAFLILSYVPNFLFFYIWIFLTNLCLHRLVKEIWLLGCTCGYIFSCLYWVASQVVIRSLETWFCSRWKGRRYLIYLLLFHLTSVYVWLPCRPIFYFVVFCSTLIGFIYIYIGWSQNFIFSKSSPYSIKRCCQERGAHSATISPWSLDESFFSFAFSAS